MTKYIKPDQIDTAWTSISIPITVEMVIEYNAYEGKEEALLEEIRQQAAKLPFGVSQASNNGFYQMKRTVGGKRV